MLSGTAVALLYCTSRVNFDEATFSSSGESIVKIGKKKWNRIVAAVLLAGFVLTFFIDETGLVAHQWLGVGVTALALYHMLLHRQWCKAVMNKSVSNLPLKTCSYGIVDAALLLGFAVVLTTGLIISTWLQLSPNSIVFWSDVHTVSSYATFLLVMVKLVIKLGFGKNKVINSRQGIFQRSIDFCAAVLRKPTVPALAAGPTGASAFLSRRKFISLIGMAGITTYLAVNYFRFTDEYPKATESPGKPLPKITAETIKNETSIATAKPKSNTTGTIQKSPAPVPAASSSREIVTGGTKAPPAAPGQTAVSTNATGSCTTLCGRSCTYPGECRRYTDRNGDGRCDFGECYS